MIKPQQQRQNEEVLSLEEYPHEMEKLESQLREQLTDLQMENIEAIADIAYKSGYMDGWKQAMFFKEIY